MKTLIVLSVVFAFVWGAPQVAFVGSPLVGSHLIAAPLIARAAPVIASPLLAAPATPLLAKVEGQAPASTVHAEHVKQEVVHIAAYSLPAPVVSTCYSF